MNKMEDYTTNTVDGAEAFERNRTRYDYIPTKAELEDDSELEDDYCGCSDPGCDCSGHKIGG